MLHFFSRLLTALAIGLAAAVVLTRYLPATEAATKGDRLVPAQVMPDVRGPSCNSLETLLDTLQSKFNETPAFGGVSNNGSALIITTGPKDDSWTVILRAPTGMACVTDGGVNFFRFKQPIPGAPL